MKYLLTILTLFYLNLDHTYSQPTIQWQRCLGGTDYDQARSIVQTTDGGYIVIGESLSEDGDVVGNHGGLDFWVVRLDSTGNILWKKTYGGSGADWPFAIRQTSDGGFVMAGFTYSNDGDVTGNHGGSDMWVVKIDKSGNLEWQKALGGSGLEEAWDVKQTKDGGYIVVGRSNSNDGDVQGNHGGTDYWVVKLRGDGQIEWQKSYGGSSLDVAYGVCQTSEGGYIVVGESGSSDGDVHDHRGNLDYWVIKLDQEGKIEWSRSLGGTGSDRANDVLQTTDGGYVVVGHASSSNGDITGSHGGFDLWAVKLDGAGGILWQRAVGGSNEDYGRAVDQTPDGGLVFVGLTRSSDGDVTLNKGNEDAWVVKLSASGELLWQRTFGGSGDDIGSSIHATTDGGFIFAGSAWISNGDVPSTQGKTDFWIVKLYPETTSTHEATPQPLLVFPNPASQTITLQLPPGEDTRHVRVTDLLGRTVVSSGQGLPSGGALDVSQLPRGLYLITVQVTSGKFFAGKFEKE